MTEQSYTSHDHGGLRHRHFTAEGDGHDHRPTAERRVPEHPGWQPWWLRYAECEGRKIVLGDSFESVKQEPHPLCPRMRLATVRYAVDEWTATVELPCGDHFHDAMIDCNRQRFDSLAEAEAAFDLACERLREGV